MESNISTEKRKAENIQTHSSSKKQKLNISNSFIEHDELQMYIESSDTEYDGKIKTNF